MSKMPRQARCTCRPLTLVATDYLQPADFNDRESQRVLSVAARALAGELGRQAAREFFMKFGGTYREQ